MSRSSTSSPTVHDGVIPSPPLEKSLESKEKDEKANRVSTAFVEDANAELAADAQRFSKLSWPHFTILLIVESIALGTLSMPGAAATLGLAPFIIIGAIFGAIASMAAMNVGHTFLKYPHIISYVDVGGLLTGRRWGSELMGVWFSLVLIFLGASHNLTGATAFTTITQSSLCTVVFSVVSAILLWLLALPPTFHNASFFGYIDFVSIVAAVLATIVAVAVDYPGSDKVQWSAVPKPGTSFADAMTAVLNIVFAYAFTTVQISFMTEMKKPQDFWKGVWGLYLIEAFIYLGTGISVYLLVGDSVQSPALLSAGHTMSRVAFGLALPVIFISGSINLNVVARYIHNRIYKNHSNPRHKYISTPTSIAVWILICVGVTLLGWIIAEVIPFFELLLSLIAALLLNPFMLGFPALMWLVLLRKDPERVARRSTFRQVGLTVANTLLLLLSIFLLVAGAYSSIKGIIDQYNADLVGKPFSCSAS